MPNNATDVVREAVFGDIFLPEPQCVCCGGKERIRPSWGAGGLNDVCDPCFYIWYDGIGCCEREECRDRRPHKHSEDIGAYSRQMKAEGKWPWNTPPGNPDNPFV